MGCTRISERGRYLLRSTDSPAPILPQTFHQLVTRMPAQAGPRTQGIPLSGLQWGAWQRKTEALWSQDPPPGRGESLKEGAASLPPLEQALASWDLGGSRALALGLGPRARVNYTKKGIQGNCQPGAQGGDRSRVRGGTRPGADVRV